MRKRLRSRLRSDCQFHCRSLRQLLLHFRSLLLFQLPPWRSRWRHWPSLSLFPFQLLPWPPPLLPFQLPPWPPPLLPPWPPPLLPFQLPPWPCPPPWPLFQCEPPVPWLP